MASIRHSSPLASRHATRYFNNSPPLSSLWTARFSTATRQFPNPTVQKKHAVSHRLVQSRAFLTPPSPLTILPSPPLQRLNARRLLSYPSPAIYDIIADVPSYSRFLPYCLSSTVTAWSAPDALQSRKWPQEAVLEVGWGVVRESFKSKIFCAPGKAVEAVWGEGQCRLSEREVQHHHTAASEQERQRELSETQKDGDGILTHLWTRWTVTPVGGDTVAENEANSSVGCGTEVALDIEFRFANPVYAAMSSAVVDGVADAMIEAFEKRVQQQLGHQRGKKQATAGNMS